MYQLQCAHLHGQYYFRKKSRLLVCHLLKKTKNTSLKSTSDQIYKTKNKNFKFYLHFIWNARQRNKTLKVLVVGKKKKLAKLNHVRFRKIRLVIFSTWQSRTATGVYSLRCVKHLIDWFQLIYYQNRLTNLIMLELQRIVCSADIKKEDNAL